MDTGNLTLYLVAILVIFLICRELTCWYFKINKTITVLEEIKDLLKYSQQVAKIENKIEPKIGDM